MLTHFGIGIYLMGMIARDIGNSQEGIYCFRGGWLVKKGGGGENNNLIKKSIAWKRRWVVLKGEKLIYYKNPRELKSIKEIPIFLIKTITVLQENQHGGGGDGDIIKNCFEITLVRKAKTIVFSAASKNERKNWVNAIEYSRSLLKNQANSKVALGGLVIKIHEISDKINHSDLFCIFSTVKNNFTKITRIYESEHKNPLPRTHLGLHKKGGDSNPKFSKGRIGTEYSRSFNEEFIFLIYHVNEIFEITLIEIKNDNLHTEVLLGKIEIPLEEIKVNSPISHQWFHFGSQSKLKVKLNMNFIEKCEELKAAENDLLYPQDKLIKTNKILLFDFSPPPGANAPNQPITISNTNNGNDFLPSSRPFSELPPPSPSKKFYFQTQNNSIANFNFSSPPNSPSISPAPIHTFPSSPSLPSSSFSSPSSFQLVRIIFSLYFSLFLSLSYSFFYPSSFHAPHAFPSSCPFSIISVFVQPFYETLLSSLFTLLSSFLCTYFFFYPSSLPFPHGVPFPFLLPFLHYFCLRSTILRRPFLIFPSLPIPFDYSLVPILFKWHEN